MLKVIPLFSGSSGNCTLVQSEQCNLLLDVGYTFSKIVNALKIRNLELQDIDAIIITHEHDDHVHALKQWSKRCPTTTIFAPQPIANVVGLQACFCQVQQIMDAFCVGDVTVETYNCSHDACCTFGYRFACNGHYVACVTDTGCVDDALVDFLSPCSTVMIESNYDEDMLRRGNYPYVLKKRILSTYGHLSNQQTAGLLTKIASGKVKNIILAHLSANNNTHELAFNNAVNALVSVGKTEGKDVFVYVADQYENNLVI